MIVNKLSQNKIKKTERVYGSAIFTENQKLGLLFFEKWKYYPFETFMWYIY